MPAKLTDKPLKRLVKVHGVESDVILWLSDAGMHMSIPGQKTKVFADWEKIAKAMYTPSNVPSFLMGDPYGLLKYQAMKKAKKGG